MPTDDLEQQGTGTAIPTTVQQSSQVPNREQPQTRGFLTNNIKVLWGLMIGIVVVLFIGFVAALISIGGMVVTSEAQRQATFEDMKDQLVTQSEKINGLSREICSFEQQRGYPCTTE